MFDVFCIAEDPTGRFACNLQFSAQFPGFQYAILNDGTKDVLYVGPGQGLASKNVSDQGATLTGLYNKKPFTVTVTKNADGSASVAWTVNKISSSFAVAPFTDVTLGDDTFTTPTVLNTTGPSIGATTLPVTNS